MKPYYQRGPVTLYHGDARDVLPGLEERGHVIMDPPYSAHVHGRGKSGARSNLYDRAPSHDVDFGFVHLAASTRRIFARHATRLASRWVLVFSDTESDHLWRRSLMACGMEYVRTAFWEKVAGSPQFTGDRPAVACEAITIAHPIGRKRWNGGGKRGMYSETVVQGAGIEPRVHTTQKPERLMLALVEDFTDPGEIVYDFTCGSGTTGIGCLRASGGPRRFVGIEREEKWVEAAAKRLDAELSGSTYHAAQAGQRPLFG